MLGIGKYLKEYIRNKKFKKDSIFCEQPVRIGKKVFIGKNSMIGKYTYIGSGQIYSDVMIGRFCSIAINVVIGAESHPLDWLSTNPFQYDEKIITNTKVIKHTNAVKTTIGNDVWIGANACIKGGITIGDGAVIGAGAVVTKDIPPYAIVIGSPARILRYRFDETTIQRLLESKWWERDIAELKKLQFNDINSCLNELGY